MVNFHTVTTPSSFAPMTLHDAYARFTPYELAFPDSAALEALLIDIDEEAAHRGADPSDPDAFIMMGAVGAFVRDIQGPDAPPETIHQYGALVFHAVHFTRSRCPVYVLGTHAARYLVEGAPEGAPTPPTPSGYLQLPQHLFWTSDLDEGSHESIDGIFWTVSEHERLHALLVTGVRPDRPGFGTVPVPEAPLGEAPSWLDAAVRAHGADFTSALPRGELDGLYSVEAAGEVLKLLARFFAYVAAVPEAVEEHGAATASDDQPPPSTLPFSRVTLHV